MHACTHNCYTFMHELDIACKNVLNRHNSMKHAYASNYVSFTLAKEPHYSDDFTSILQEQECVAQISVVYHACSLPPFASSIWVIATKGLQFIMDTQNVLTNWGHICSNLTMGFVSIALACIFKVILINTI